MPVTEDATGSNQLYRRNPIGEITLSVGSVSLALNGRREALGIPPVMAFTVMAFSFFHVLNQRILVGNKRHLGDRLWSSGTGRLEFDFGPTRLRLPVRMPPAVALLISNIAVSLLLLFVSGLVVRWEWARVGS